MKSALFTGLAAAMCLLGAAMAAPAPQLKLTNLAELPMVERTPYDVNANAQKDVDAAFARARKNHKRVLIDMGGNWCPDCLILANLMRLPEMQRFIDAHFEVVAVDIGRFDKNQDIPARFGIKGRLPGVPAVVIAEPDGTFVNPGKISALSDARHMSAQAIADWLAGWAK
ncbi:MAG: thioredoxin family protein [Rhizomicrobium sp.]